MSNDLYPRDRIVVVESLTSNDLYLRARLFANDVVENYEEDDKPGALFSVIGEMMLEAMDLGLGAHDLAEELRALAARIDSADKEQVDAEEDAAEKERWLYGEDPFGADAEEVTADDDTYYPMSDNEGMLLPYHGERPLLATLPDGRMVVVSADKVIVGDGTHTEAVSSDSPKTLNFKGCA